MKTELFPADAKDETRAVIKSDIADETGGSRQIRLIPWPKIRGSLNMAKARGNDGIIKVFLRALSDQALFDDRGAWCRRSN